MKLKSFKLGSFDSDAEHKIKIINLESLFKNMNYGLVEILSDGAEYRLDIEEVIRIPDLHNKSDRFLEEVLEKITSYRVSLTVSEANLTVMLSNVQIDFDFWMLNQEEKKKEELKTSFTKTTENFVKDKLFLSEKFRDDYKEKKNLIVSIEALKTKIISLNYILGQRAGIITTILERRKNVKGLNNTDQGI